MNANEGESAGHVPSDSIPSEADDGAPEATPTSRLSARRFGAIPRVWRDSRVRVGTALSLGVIAPGVMVLIDAAEIPVAATVLLSVALAALFLFVELALSATAARAKIQWLWAALMVAVTIPAGAWAYHALFDSVPESYTFYLEGVPSYILQPSGMPGAPAGFSGGPIAAGTSHHFECKALDDADRIWLRSSSRSTAGDSWFEARHFIPVGDFTAQDLPDCY